MTDSIFLRSEWDDRKNLPALSKKPNEPTAQPAYITLDLQSGEVDLWVQQERGSLPMRMFHGAIRLYPIQSELTREEILDGLHEHWSKLQTLFTVAEDALDGDGPEARFSPTETIRELDSTIERAFERLSPESLVLSSETEVADHFEQDIAGSESARDLAGEILSLNGGEFYLADSLADLDRLIEIIESNRD